MLDGRCTASSAACGVRAREFGGEGEGEREDGGGAVVVVAGFTARAGEREGARDGEGESESGGRRTAADDAEEDVVAAEELVVEGEGSTAQSSAGNTAWRLPVSVLAERETDTEDGD